MQVSHTKQGTDQWFQEKVGIPSASNADKIVTMKGEPSKQRTKYMYQLAIERLTGKKTETYHSKKMDEAIIMEQEAREVFEMDNKCDVDQVGFCLSDCGRYGCSPDGLISGKKEGLEIKCPESHTHVEYLLANKLPSTYFQQVQGSLLVSGYDAWWFYSYYPGDDVPKLQIRVEPDRNFLVSLTVELKKFCDELDELTEKLRSR